jgi:tetratricopeptide (TPR) repeat protein
MLFTERAAAASGTFELTDSNQAAVVHLCRRLDGLPLAIELAAVRTRVLTTEQILERLTDRFALLTGGSRAALPRHQTLQTTIDWSHDLLTADEQALFRRLCVFAGRFTLDDVEAACAFDPVPVAQALALLSLLVDKSLVMKEDVTRFACYRLHETMREYASLKLRDANEVDVLEGRCIEYYRTRCLRFADQARYQPVEWLEWLDVEIDNIRLVLQRCIARGDFGRGLDLAASIGHYWITRGTTEGVRWFDQLLARGEASPQMQVRAYYLRGWLSLIQGDPAAARPWLARAVATARESSQLGPLSVSLSMSATAEAAVGELEPASRFLHEAEEMTAALHDYPATIELVSARANLAFFRGDIDTAKAASSEGVRLSREAGYLIHLESLLRNLGVVAMIAGDLDNARLRFVEALRVAQQIDHRIAQYYLLSLLGWHAASSGQRRLAAQLLGAAETIRTGVGANIIGPHVPMLAAAKESAIAALGASEFEAEFETGKHLSREAALRLAFAYPIVSTLRHNPSRRATREAGGRGRPIGRRRPEQ